MSFSYDRHDDDEPIYSYNITGVAISNKSIVILSSIGFGFLGFALYFLILRRTADQNDASQEDDQRDVYGEMLDQSDVATLNRAQRRARAKFRMKKARRAAVPVQRAAEGVDDGDAGGPREEGGDVGENGDLADVNNLGRKERQRVAKAMEQKERKVYAEEARKWRQNNPSIKTGDSDCSSRNKGKTTERSNEEKEPSLDDILPTRTNEDDNLSEFLFWKSIASNIENKSNSLDEKIAQAQQMRKMTIREFIERLKEYRSVSIAALADEFAVSINQALVELENINKQHGIVGIVDAKGNFVYVSMKMIKMAVKLGQDAGRISSPILSTPLES